MRLLPLSHLLLFFFNLQKLKYSSHVFTHTPVKQYSPPPPLFNLTLFELKQQYRQTHKDTNPDKSADEAVINHGVRYRPASGQHRPH